MMRSTIKSGLTTWLPASESHDSAQNQAKRISLRALPLLGLLLALSVALSGCGDDDPVNPGGADSAIDGGGDAGADGGIDGGGLQVDSTGPQAKLTFNIAHAKGNGLVDPVNAQILDLALDKYPGLTDPGFQVDVQINGINVPDGTEIDVQLDGKSVGKVTMTGGTAELAKVTLQCTASQSAISVLATVTGNQVSATKAAKLDCGDGCTAALVPVNGCVTEDADPATPGLQATFQVTSTTPDCTHAQLRVTDVSGKVQETPKVSLVAGKATVTATVAADTTGVVNETATVVGIVIDEAHAERPKGESDALAVPITTDAPSVAIVAPDKAQLTLADDADGKDANGVQVTIVGTATTMKPSDIEKLVVKVDGVEVGKTSMKLNGGFEFDLSFATSKTWEVTVEATNACGLSATGKRSYKVAASKAKLKISSPSSGAVLNAKNDTDLSTATVLETNFEVAIQGANDGDKVSVFCRPNQAGSPYPITPNGTATVTGGAATLSLPLSIDATAVGTSVVCVARDNGANPAESPEVALTVGLPPPCMTIKLPKEGFVTASATLPVGATATGLEGAVVEAKLALVDGATLIDTPIGKITGGAFTGALALTIGSPPLPIPHGTYVLSLNAADTFGNAVNTGNCSTLSRTIVVDRKPPLLALAIPTKQVLDPAGDADSDVVSPGYQTKVVFSVGGESDLTTSTVCASVNGFALPCQTITGNGQLTFSSVTLQPGANIIVATAKDALGNVSKDVIVNITLQSNAAMVKWIKPATSTFVATDSLQLEISVTDQALGVPVNGAAITLILNGKETPGVVFSASGNGLYSAKATGLALGPNTLQVTALPVGAATEGVSPQLTVTRKGASPTIALQGLTNGEIVNLAKASCIAGLTDCITNLNAVTTNAADGSTATLVVTCDLAAAVTATATVTGGVAGFSLITLPHGAKCTLQVSVIDEAAQQALGAPIAVSIDRVAPVFSVFSPLTTALLALSDANGNPADGVQVATNVSLSGLEKDRPIVLQVFNDGGTKAFEATSAMPSTATAGQAVSVNFGVVTYPAGKTIKLTITTSDLAGNPATFTATFVVVPDAAEVRLIGPTFVDPKSCSVHSDCGTSICQTGKCTIPWNKNTFRQFTVIGLGLLTGAKARICSDNGNVTGPSCATAGTKEIVAPTDFDGVQVALLAQTLNEGLHTLHAEVLPAGANAATASNWLTSIAASATGSKTRRILYDATPPVVAAVTAPAAAGVPAKCLARASQLSSDGFAPGGVFVFAATIANDDG